MADEPNINIGKVINAENLVISLAAEIASLGEANTEQYNAKYEALEYLANFENNQLKMLRNIYQE